VTVPEIQTPEATAALTPTALTPTDARIDCLWPAPHTDLTDAELLQRFTRDDRAAAWLRVNFISSIDGAATSGGLSAGLGMPADHRVFNLLRRLTDVVLVGAGTVRAEGYGPMRVGEADAAWRTDAGLPAHPVFAIVSGCLDLDPASPIFTDAPVRPIVITTDRAPGGARAALARVADVLVCGDTALDLHSMRTQLTDRGLAQIHCEGGPSLFGALTAAGAVDELCLTMSPRLEAGDSGRINTGPTPEPLAMELAHVLRSDDALLLRYIRQR
jgi:riboflavin biosynthesis pyrimidine reductase